MEEVDRSWVTEDSVMYAGEFALYPEFTEGAERLQEVQGLGEIHDSGGCIENASGLNKVRYPNVWT